MMIFTVIITRSEEGVYAMQANYNFINLKIYKSQSQLDNLAIVLTLNLLLIGIALFDINSEQKKTEALNAFIAKKAAEAKQLKEGH